MGNVYGVSAPGYTPGAITAASDVTCAAGSETLILTTTTALIAPGPGNWYLTLLANLTFTLGASAPSALVIAARIHGGSDYDSLTLNTGLLVNSAVLFLPVFLVSAASDTAFIGSGSIIEITANPTGQAVTFNHAGSRAFPTLAHGPDA